MAKQNAAYTYKGKRPSLKKEECCNVDEHEDTMQCETSKSQRQMRSGSTEVLRAVHMLEAKR
jgi:hypothetical protein